MPGWSSGETRPRKRWSKRTPSLERCSAGKEAWLSKDSYRHREGKPVDIRTGKAGAGVVTMEKVLRLSRVRPELSHWHPVVYYARINNS